MTSLRYLPAVAVVVAHINPYFLSSGAQRAATYYWYVGVAFFYLLSGFVLTWSCSTQRVRIFWWNRFSRIWPLQLTMMILTYLLLWYHEPRPSNGAGWLLQFLLLQAWDPNNNVHSGGNGVTWSLSCEFFFYAMFPLLIAGIRRLRARGLIVTAAGVVAAEALVPAAVGSHVSPATYEWLFFYFPGYRIGEFILGMLLARAFVLGLRFRRPSFGYLAGWMWCAAWVAVATEYSLRHHGPPIPRPFVTLMVMPAFAVLLVAGASADIAGRTRLMGSWLAIRLGEWSFALYLVHGPLAELMRVYVWLPRGSGAGAMLVFITGATAVAAVAHYAVEKPVERWLRSRVPGFRPTGGPEDTGGRNRPGLTVVRS